MVATRIINSGHVGLCGYWETKDHGSKGRKMNLLSKPEVADVLHRPQPPAQCGDHKAPEIVPPSLSSHPVVPFFMVSIDSSPSSSLVFFSFSLLLVRTWLSMLTPWLSRGAARSGSGGSIELSPTATPATCTRLLPLPTRIYYVLDWLIHTCMNTQSYMGDQAGHRTQKTNPGIVAYCEGLSEWMQEDGMPSCNCCES